jgi:hypothetical protein
VAQSYASKSKYADQAQADTNPSAEKLETQFVFAERPSSQSVPNWSRKSSMAVVDVRVASYGSQNVPSQAPIIHGFFVAPSIPICLSTPGLGIIARSAVVGAGHSELASRFAPIPMQ